MASKIPSSLGKTAAKTAAKAAAVSPPISLEETVEFVERAMNPATPATDMYLAKKKADVAISESLRGPEGAAKKASELYRVSQTVPRFHGMSEREVADALDADVSLRIDLEKRLASM